MFCVRCGRDAETFDGLCAECFLNGKEMIALPRYIDIERCASCEEFRIGGHWVKRTMKEAAEDAAVNSIASADRSKITSAGALATELDEKNFLVKVDVRGEMGGRTVSANAGTTVRMKNCVCQKCSRQLGNYYEATLQIRSGAKELSDTLRDETVRYVRNRIENMSAANRQLFLTKVEEVQGGVDMLLSSMSSAKTLAKELSDIYGAETKEAPKLIGKNPDGTDMYRMTYLVRMPEYRLNDIVIFSGRPYKLSGIGKGNGKLTGLEDFRVISVRRSQMSEMRVHTPYEELIRATVVSRSKNEIQILRPSDYSTVDIRIPDGAVIADTVNVVDIDDTLFFVP